MQSTQTELTSNNMLQVFLEGDDKFNFVVKPNLGSRRITLVSRQHQDEISYMNFISNNKILVIFKFGKIMCFNDTGKLSFLDNLELDGMDQKEGRRSPIRVLAESMQTMTEKSILIQHGEQGKERQTILTF